MNTIDLIDINYSNRKNKRFVATFLINNKLYKYIHFGLKNPKYGTYIDHHNEIKRNNYIARHIAMEKEYLNNPLTPASLSMYILWGPYIDINKNIELYKKIFNV
jgi:hypothetical protein